jgi:hypothetical protein
MSYQQPQPPPDRESAKSMLHIGAIFSIIIGIIAILVGLLDLAFAVLVTAITGGLLAIVLIGPIFVLISAAIDFLIYFKAKETMALVDSGQYEAAKSHIMLWMILGFIFGWIIVGVFLLLAYTKFDALINWQRSQQGGYAQPPMMGQPQAQPQYGQPAPQPAPAYTPPQTYQPAQPTAQPVAAPQPAAAAPPPAPTPAGTTCPSCQRPATFIAQYNRYYCYSCSKYV